MAHPNEQLIRDAYAAFGRGDLDGYLGACTADFVFNVPGQNQMTGRYQGRDGFLQLATKVMELTGGKFEEEVHDVLANDEHGVVLAIHRFARHGQPKEYRTAHIYQLRNSKLAECWEQPQDPAAFDDAWA